MYFILFFFFLKKLGEDVVLVQSPFKYSGHRYTREILDLVYHPVWWGRLPWGSNWRSSGFCRPHMQYNAKPMRPRPSRALWHLTFVLSSRLDHSRCRWHMHLTNHCYFDYRKTRRSPIWARYRDENGAGFGISLENLWFWHKIVEETHDLCVGNQASVTEIITQWRQFGDIWVYDACVMTINWNNNNSLSLIT